MNIYTFPLKVIRVLLANPFPVHISERYFILFHQYNVSIKYKYGFSLHTIRNATQKIFSQTTLNTSVIVSIWIKKFVALVQENRVKLFGCNSSIAYE